MAATCCIAIRKSGKIPPSAPARVIHPRQDDDDVAEIGYIYSMRDEVFLKQENRVNLVWFVKVPATGARYSCGYEYGFPDFRTGDDVRIIHPRIWKMNLAPVTLSGSMKN